MAIFPSMDGKVERTEHWLWIGGWASSVEVWDPWITASFPQWKHGYLAVEQLLDLSPEALVQALRMEDGSRPDVILAWSLGSHVALRLWNAGAWPEAVRLVAICPVVEFCAAEGPWKRIHLDRMIRGLGRDRAAVLCDFRELLWGAMPEEEVSRWNRAAAEIPLERLVRGLECLRDGRLEGIRPGPGLELIEGAHDRVVPRLDVVLGALAFEGIGHHALATGHVPFLEDPEGFGTLLHQGIPHR